MTPGARVAAAIEVLNDIFADAAPEKALTGWGRAHRFAGSKDRAAIRDHVFQALRCRASYAWMGGADTGRGVMIGAMREVGLVDEMFCGVGHAPAPVTTGEEGAPRAQAPRDIALDMPAWLLPHFDRALGADADHALEVMRSRAGVFLRVNLAKTDPSAAMAALAKDGIGAVPVDHVKTALHVTENERKVAQSQAYLDGLVEVQDPSSQIAIDALGLKAGQRVLDFCAGGGGKALAMAALGAEVTAHDIEPRRMADIPARAARADAAIGQAAYDDLAQMPPFDVVLCDAPCSGSGTWRRAPCAKWELTPDRLLELNRIQLDVLRQAAPFVAPGGVLAYATCSVFEGENSDVIQSFTSGNSHFSLTMSRGLLPRAAGDGFFFSLMQRRA